MKDRRNMKDSTMKHFNPMALREKYSASNVQRTNPFSSFWADNEWDSRRTDFLDDEPQKKGVDHVALASYRRAISNFVTIVTNQSDIPVIFQSNDNSFTDGKKVVIGSKIDEKNFDPVVGLALHEGSHIKLSDFSFLRNLDKGYYHSMYDKYFHSKVIDKALLTDEYTSLDWDSYIFRILNLTNKNTRLNVLPDLDKIYNTIFGDGRVKKLNDTAETFDVAIEVVNLIYKNLLDGLKSTDEYGDTKNQPASDVKKNKEKYGESPNELSDSELNDLIEAIENNDVGSGDGEPVTLTEAQKKQLNRAIKKQNDFVDGKPSKVGKLSKKDSSIVKTMEEAGVDRVTAGEGMKTEYDYTIGDYVKGKGCQVIVVRKLTQAMIDDNIFPSVVSSYNRYKDTSIIQNGISLGTKLGRKLQVRGESRETKWTRLDSGKIDKRLIAEAGFGNERVFSTSFIDSYSDAFLHISVDASGSMGGDKWINAMTSVISICKAASMIQNLDVVVSLRSTHSNDNRWNSNSTSPLILIAYDSRVDKFSKVKKMFPYLHPGGTTPEGLCFEAIMNDIIPTTNDLDSYFLNFSDGMPMFSSDTISYYNDDAVNHTKKMVNEIRGRGIKVLSYYIGGEYERESTQADFKTMYGKDANFINVKSVVDVSKTMNKKFLEKN
jgi:hypothetical protein